jgi:hypothetical protein
MAQKRSKITQPSTRSRLATSTTSSWRGKLQDALDAYQQSLNIRRTLAKQHKSSGDDSRAMRCQSPDYPA